MLAIRRASDLREGDANSRDLPIGAATQDGSSLHRKGAYMLRRILTGVLTAILLVSAVPVSSASSHGWRWNECRYQYKDGHAGFSVKEVKATIRCGAAHFGVSVTTAMYVADRESRFRATAVNSSSGACGVFQHMPRLYPDRLKAVPFEYKWLSSRCLDGRSNVLAALWTAHKYGWGPWSM